MNSMNTLGINWITPLATTVNSAVAQQGSAVGVPGATAAPAGPSTTETGSTSVPSTGQPLPAQPVGAGGASQFSFAIPMIVMMVLLLGFTFWQNRRQTKQREELIKSVKKGDRVAMTGGVLGMIVEMNEEEIVLQVEQGRIRFSRSALVGVVKSGRELPESKVEVKQSTAVNV